MEICLFISIFKIIKCIIIDVVVSEICWYDMLLYGWLISRAVIGQFQVRK